MKLPSASLITLAVITAVIFSCKKDDAVDSAIEIAVVPDSLNVRLSSTENAVDIAFRFTYNGVPYTASVDRPFLNQFSYGYLAVLNPVVLPPTATLTVDATRTPNALIANAVTLPNVFDLSMSEFPDVAGESVKLFKRITFNLALSTKVIFTGQDADFAATYKDSTALLASKVNTAFKLFNDSSPDVAGIQRSPSVAYVK